VDPQQQRADYRVEVPATSVREVAFWPCADSAYARLDILDLGLPSATLSGLGPERLSLCDLSIHGLGLTIDPPGEMRPSLVQGATCFTWLQLWDTSPANPYGVLSLFTLNRMCSVSPRDERLFLGLRFLRFALGSKREKTLEFRNAQQGGVPLLARWCDNLLRGAASHEPGHQSGGLDLDNLLDEIEHARRAANSRPDKGTP